MPPWASLTLTLAGLPFARLFFVNAGARFGNRFHGAEVGGGFVNQRLDEFQQFPAGLGIARRDARLDQHLQFPVAPARGVIVLRAFERLADFAVPSVGAQPQIHPVTHPFGGISGKHFRHAVGCPLEEFFSCERRFAMGFRPE